MNALSISALSLLSIATVPALMAQPVATATVMAGPGIAVAGIFDRARLGVFAGSLECGAFESGGGIRASAGGEILLPRLFGERWGLAGAFGVDHAVVGWTALPTEPTRIVDRAGSLVELQREYRQRYRELGTYLRVVAEYSPLDRWSVGLGASLRYTLSGACDQSEEIVGPGAYTFSDGAREHAMPTGDMLRRTALAIEPMLALSYALPLGSSVVLRPQALVSCEITAPSGMDIRRRFTAGGSLALLYALPMPPTPPTVPPSPVMPALAASLAMRGIDPKGSVEPVASVEVRELTVREVAPLLPAVFFEHDAATLPSRYRLIPREERGTFSPAGLAGIGIYELQHRALDVIGARLLAHPGATVTLAGIVAEGEAAPLGRRRAEFVDDYLERVWGIDHERISIVGEGFLERSSEQTEDGRADNRRVEIASSAGEVLAPVVTEQVEREFDPPVLRIDPAVTAMAGVRGWSVVVTHGEDTVARYGGDGPAGLGRTDMVWRIDDVTGDPAPSPVIADLTVEDSSGAVITARASVPLAIRRSVRRIDGGIVRMGNRERISYSLVGFDFDADRISPGDEGMLREIARITRRGATVTITGYTDRIGDREHNIALSSARARNAASVMRMAITEPGVSIEERGTGMETTRFSNDTPEGRMLSRGVSIVVEQEAGGVPLSDDLSR